jgi:hypothetical protein
MTSKALKWITAAARRKYLERKSLPEREARLRRTLVIAALSFLVLSGLMAGCGGSQDPAAWLEDCGREVENYVGGTGYVHFVQEMENIVGTAQGEFGQVLRIEGDIIFPDQESYQYEEAVSSTLQPDQQQDNSFSYLTLDGGTTAYVKGERLEAELGVAGWIHYTPSAEQNRFFDYPQLIGSILTMGREPEWLGYEDSGGVRCAHLRFGASGQDLLDMRIQEDPAFAEQYQGLDVSQIAGELSAEIWIGEEDRLPWRVSMVQTASLEAGAMSDTRLDFVFSGYGEEPPLPIVAPAFSHEAV